MSDQKCNFSRFSLCLNYYMDCKPFSSFIHMCLLGHKWVLMNKIKMSFVLFQGLVQGKDRPSFQVTFTHSTIPSKANFTRSFWYITLNAIRWRWMIRMRPEDETIFFLLKKKSIGSLNFKIALVLYYTRQIRCN